MARASSPVSTIPRPLAAVKHEIPKVFIKISALRHSQELRTLRGLLKVSMVPKGEIW